MQGKLIKKNEVKLNDACRNKKDGATSAEQTGKRVIYNPCPAMTTSSCVIYLSDFEGEE